MTYQQPTITSEDRRIGVELTKLLRHCGSISVNLIDDYKIAICVCIDIDNIKNNITFQIEKFPFRQPIIMINNLYYDFYFKILNNNINEIFKTITKLDPKHGSITKANNWFPGIWLTHIMDEIKDVLKSRRKAYQIYYCRKICKDYLVHDLPLEDYL